MDDGHAYATLARGASHCGDGSAVPRTIQIVSDRRGRSSLDGAALCGTQRSARILCSVPRNGAGPAFGAGSVATRQSSTRDRCPCRRTGYSTFSRWRPRRSWRHCGVRWSAEHRLARRPGKSDGETPGSGVHSTGPWPTAKASSATPKPDLRLPTPFPLPYGQYFAPYRSLLWANLVFHAGSARACPCGSRLCISWHGTTCYAYLGTIPLPHRC